MYLRYPSSIKKFARPPPASRPVNRNVNDEECLPLVSVLKGWTSLFSEVLNDVHITKILRKELLSRVPSKMTRGDAWCNG